MTPQEFMAAAEAIGKSEQLIEFATTPGRALILISYLQLALRHPEAGDRPTSDFIRQMIDNLAQAIATTTGVEAIQEMVARGYDQAFDMTDEEAAQYFGTVEAQAE